MRHAGPVILDRHREREPEAALHQRNAAGDTCLDADFASSRNILQRLRRIPDDVEQGLRQLLRIRLEFGQADVEVGMDYDLGKLRLHDAGDSRQKLVDVGAPVSRQAMRRQQPVDQRLQAIRLADDHLRVFDQRRAVELALEELRGPADAAERILDLVRQAAYQFAIRLLLLEQAFLARDL